jgi:hypothetical protein
MILRPGEKRGICGRRRHSGEGSNPTPHSHVEKIKKSLFEALGWHRGMELKVDKNPDDSVTVRKT